MSYRLCCGSLNVSDLSLAMGDPARPLSIHSGIADPVAGPSNTPAIENIAEICRHPVKTGKEVSGEENDGSGLYKFDFKQEDNSVKPKVKTASKLKGERCKTLKKSSKFWPFKFGKHSVKNEAEDSKETICASDEGPCVFTGYRRTDGTFISQNIQFGPKALLGTRSSTLSPIPSSSSRLRLSMGAGPGPSALAAQAGDLLQLVPAPPQKQGSNIIDLSRFNPDDYPTEDVDEIRIAQRARDIELGIEISPRHIVYPHLLYGGGSPQSNSSPSPETSARSSLSDPVWNLTPNFQSHCVVTTITYPTFVPTPAPAIATAASSTHNVLNGHSSSNSQVNNEVNCSEYGAVSTLLMPQPSTSFIPQPVHTQIDFIHCLVPDLNSIANCGSYWGVMDRYEAERLLENRPEGTFLLRDSAQEEFLFSVSFRRYGRSLHARIEQWNHRFSFDSHDPGVYAAESVTALIEHYKEPSSCMFFEPLLTIPLNRTFPFSLQHLCRSVICSCSSYDGLNFLPLPKAVREYLKYYHYKQKVRVRRFEMAQ